MPTLIKTRPRYRCEFCRHIATTPAIERHERICWKNPNRYCDLCENTGNIHEEGHTFPCPYCGQKTKLYEFHWIELCILILYLNLSARGPQNKIITELYSVRVAANKSSGESYGTHILRNIWVNMVNGGNATLLTDLAVDGWLLLQRLIILLRDQ